MNTLIELYDRSLVYVIQSQYPVIPTSKKQYLIEWAPAYSVDITSSCVSLVDLQLIPLKLEHRTERFS